MYAEQLQRKAAEKAAGEVNSKATKEATERNVSILK